VESGYLRASQRCTAGGRVPVIYQLATRNVSTDPTWIHMPIQLPTILLFKKRHEQIDQFGFTRGRFTWGGVSKKNLTNQGVGV